MHCCRRASACLCWPLRVCSIVWGVCINTASNSSCSIRHISTWIPLVQVVPVVSLNGSASQSSGRQLGTPAAWPLPAWGWAPPLPRQDGNQGQVPGYSVDASAGSSPFSSAVTIVGGRRLMASTGGQLSGGLHAVRSSRRVLADAAAASPAAPIVAPMKRPPKPGTSCALHCTALHPYRWIISGRLCKRLVLKVCYSGLQSSKWV